MEALQIADRDMEMDKTAGQSVRNDENGLQSMRYHFYARICIEDMAVGLWRALIDGLIYNISDD